MIKANDGPRVGRTVPIPTETSEPFWTGGRNGALLIGHCTVCGRWHHPPESLVCPDCGGAVSPKPVAGTGTVFTFTVNRHQYHPAAPPPYVIALVELTEQTGLRIATNIVDCLPEQVQIGMRVEVTFVQEGEVFVPLFRPAVVADHTMAREVSEALP